MSASKTESQPLKLLYFQNGVESADRWEKEADAIFEDEVKFNDDEDEVDVYCDDGGSGRVTSLRINCSESCAMNVW